MQTKFCNSLALRILALLLLGTLNSFSQDISSSIELNRIRNLRDFWYVKLISSQKRLSIGLRDKNHEENQMTFEPNIGNYTGFGLFAFDVGLEVTFRTPASVEQNAAYGPTQATDFQVHMYTRRMGVDFIYQDYKGFYLADPSYYFPSWEVGDQYPRQSDLTVKILSLGYYYIFKPDKFSFPAAFNQTEVQLKTGGSWFISGQYANSTLRDPLSIIPITDTNNFIGFENLNSIRLNSFNILPGYSLNIIFWKKWYINLSLALGAGYQIRSYHNNELHQDNTIAFANTWRAGLGYNGRRFFFGMNGFTQTNNTTIDNLEVSSSNGFIKFFIGYRFQEKGIMKRSVLELLDVFQKKQIE